MMGVTHFIRGCVTGVILLLFMSIRLLSTPPAIAGIFCSVLAPLTAAEPKDVKRNYNLPRGDAATTLSQFAETSNRQIIFMMETVRGVITNPVQGELNAAQAIERMLANTALVAVRDAETEALMISRAPKAPPAVATSPREAKTSAIDAAASTPRKGLFAAVKTWLVVALAPLQTLSGAADAAAGTGTVTGRIYNPAAGEYLRNASVRVVGGPATASEDGGVYRLSGVPVGEIALVVEYTGYRSATSKVRVGAGETVTRDFELFSALDAADGTVKLGAFVVSSQRAGNAKAIMEQRNSMNITNSVSSDVFGEVSEGNVGEFLKHLPGLVHRRLQSYATSRAVAQRHVQSLRRLVRSAGCDVQHGRSHDAGGRRQSAH